MQRHTSYNLCTLVQKASTVSVTVIEEGDVDVAAGYLVGLLLHYGTGEG